MSGSVFFLHMAGAIALLLWATHMVRSGVERAYGELLKQRLRRTLGHPLLAAATGLALAVALQAPQPSRSSWDHSRAQAS